MTALLQLLSWLCPKLMLWADLTVTAANVALVSGNSESGTAGATITAGQAVYLDSADSRLKLCDAGAATTDDLYGIALHASLAGQPLAVQRAGVINLGATLVVGEVYMISETAGAICPVADIVAGDFVTMVGVALTAANLQLHKLTTSTAHG
jgi:hypothetical protein